MVYVVTNPELGWDCVVGVFSDEDYVYSKYSGENYVITPIGVDNTKYQPKKAEDLAKYGRSDYQYKVVTIDKYKYLEFFKADITFNNKTVTVYEIIDPTEETHVIEFSGEEQPHTVETFSVIADLFCEYTKTPKESIVIFWYNNDLYLGSTEPFEDSKELWRSFMKKDVELYC